MCFIKQIDTPIFVNIDANTITGNERNSEFELKMIYLKKACDFLPATYWQIPHSNNPVIHENSETS
jgi:predicted component of type VI protein secretion system